MDRVTELSQKAIGPTDKGDSILRSADHIKILQKPGNARLLIDILQQPELQKIVQTYMSSDRRARRAQNIYKGLAKTAIILVFFAVLAASIGAALPLDQMPFIPLTEHSARLIAIVTLFVALSGAFFILFLLELFKPFERWHSARGKAELARKEIFLTIFNATTTDTAGQGELPLLPLKLEYFRRYLLDHQANFYLRRGSEFKSAEKRKRILWIIATLGILFTIIFTFLVGIVAPASEQGGAQIMHLLPDHLTGILQRYEIAHIDSYLLAGGIVLAGLFAVMLSFSLLDDAKSNTVRYLNSHQNLVDLRTQGLAIAQQKALLDDEDGVMAFVYRIMAQISAEHQDWAKLPTIAQITIGQTRVDQGVEHPAE